ncbi:putative zinc-finger of acetyl-transferase ESCO [Lyophyllum shimeji]|uniref:Zinc-finger of acetyl-transferase ESCO n=1 Tax=Lyophyllum shimeji TaxID=47721 RepID=A0A9P3URW5_LYOSH|nr:putative zinc-finger of acetyl-transferase ESCO [Lyophyllum shimeji]
MSTKVTRTYGSKKSSFARSSSPALPSSPASDTSLGKRKRPLREQSNVSLGDAHPPPKRVKPTLPKSKENEKTNTKEKQKTLTQLHFCIDQTILRACPKCGLSYTKGAPDDESLHRTHCARIQKGMEWGREEEKEMVKSGLVPIATGIRLKDGTKGRIICVRADAGGKLGSKITALLETINLTLSSPPLTPEILRESKAYLFLLQSSGREKIAGCVIAQRISTAMAIATCAECEEATRSSTDSTSQPTATLVAVDTSTGLFCHPAPLPTPLGISRLFVPSAHRRQGIARHLLSAAADTFIHGCPLDPRKGHVAFTQPTGDGHAVMMKWGRGGVRIYEG